MNSKQEPVLKVSLLTSNAFIYHKNRAILNKLKDANPRLQPD